MVQPPRVTIGPTGQRILEHPETKEVIVASPAPVVPNRHYDRFKRTVICHFYNEEVLLPWWLTHHKHIFDHGIMIDYGSTDNSYNLIRQICPSWEIRKTKNEFFDAIAVDDEVMEIERELHNWRMALNVTEFLYGNYDHLKDTREQKQFLIGNYVFVDMEDIEKGQTILDQNHPLYKQRYWGYDEFANDGVSKGGLMARMNRSIHTYPIAYPGGRHFGDRKKKSFDDLVIFYYGWYDVSSKGLQRKIQIQDKIGYGGEQHKHDEQSFYYINKELQKLSIDLRLEIAPIIAHNKRITGQDF